MRSALETAVWRARAALTHVGGEELLWLAVARESLWFVAAAAELAARLCESAGGQRLCDPDRSRPAQLQRLGDAGQRQEEDKVG